MDTQIKTSYAQCIENNCLWHSELAEIRIKDEDGGSCVEVADCALADFIIDNKNQKKVALLAIDKCIFDDQSAHKKCDFAFYARPIFALVEIKDTYNRTSSRKKQAKQQLESTIQQFLSKLNFEGYQLRVIISWKYIPARPAVSTYMQAAKLEFLEKYNAILTEGNKFTLE